MFVSNLIQTKKYICKLFLFILFNFHFMSIISCVRSYRVKLPLYVSIDVMINVMTIMWCYTTMTHFSNSQHLRL